MLIAGTSFFLLATPIQTWGHPKKKAMPLPHPINVGTLRAAKVA